MVASSRGHALPTAAGGQGFLQKLNGEWHKRSLQVFMVIVLAHWAEHLAQATQIYLLNWPPPQAGGVIGLWAPWVIKSEILHYGYALIMLIGLWMLRKGFQGRSRTWWMISFGIQFWHHIEHLILQAQAIFGVNLFGSPVPTSIIQLWIPRVELHLFYNGVVFIPMVIGMYYHLFPPANEEPNSVCSCAWSRDSATVCSS
jgi:hypothetical protein